MVAAEAEAEVLVLLVLVLVVVVLVAAAVVSFFRDSHGGHRFVLEVSALGPRVTAEYPHLQCISTRALLDVSCGL